MRTDPRRAAILAAVIGVGLAVPDRAAPQSPLSAIDWLSDSVVVPAPVVLPRSGSGRAGLRDPGLRRRPGAPREPVFPREPSVATSALPEQITVTPLGAPSPDTIGLVSARQAGLPADLWGTSSTTVLARRLSEAPVPEIPALRDLLHSLLIAELAPPADSAGAPTLFLARVDALLALGSLDEAARLIDRAGRTRPEFFRRWFDIALLNGTEDSACARMLALPQISPTYAARIFCLARGRDWKAAALTLDTAEALGLVDPLEGDLLARFLLADISEDAPPLPPARKPTPLMFSMYSAVGEPISTANLPVAFAHADLRPVTGWKARIAAAERLTRIGAIPGEALLAIYAERKPAASGGVWDRVAAFHALRDALDSGDAEAVSAALPAVWAGIEEAELEVAIADALVDRLEALPLGDAAAAIRLRLMLLSSRFDEADADAASGPEQTFWIALARGAPETADPPDPVAGALRDGFVSAGAPVRLQSLFEQDRRGEAILRAIDLFEEGAEGNLDKLQDAVTLLRAAGLERVAIRAALQLLILDRRA